MLVHSGRSVSIGGVTLRNGLAGRSYNGYFSGGGILNFGGLTISNSTVSERSRPAASGKTPGALGG